MVELIFTTELTVGEFNLQQCIIFYKIIIYFNAARHIQRHSLLDRLAMRSKK